MNDDSLDLDDPDFDSKFIKGLTQSLTNEQFIIYMNRQCGLHELATGDKFPPRRVIDPKLKELYAEYYEHANKAKEIEYKIYEFLGIEDEYEEEEPVLISHIIDEDRTETLEMENILLGVGSNCVHILEAIKKTFDHFEIPYKIEFLHK